MDSVNEKFKLLQKNLNMLSLLVSRGDFASADEHLKSICNLEEEQDEIKSQINADEICYVSLLKIINLKWQTTFYCGDLIQKMSGYKQKKGYD